MFDKLKAFPFYYKVTQQTRSWYQRICNDIFGLDFTEKSLKWTILVCDSEDEEDDFEK
jgi:hypothetical protein